MYKKVLKIAEKVQKFLNVGELLGLTLNFIKRNSIFEINTQPGMTNLSLVRNMELC